MNVWMLGMSVLGKLLEESVGESKKCVVRKKKKSRRTIEASSLYFSTSLASRLRK
jgi:hypothetical protein